MHTTQQLPANASSTVPNGSVSPAPTLESRSATARPKLLAIQAHPAAERESPSARPRSGADTG